MTRLSLMPAEADVCRLVGTEAFVGARQHLDRGEVSTVQWLADRATAYGEVRGSSGRHSAIAVLVHDPDGRLAQVDTSCTCAEPSHCAHATAIILSTLPGRPEQQMLQLPLSAEDRPRVVQQPAPWERALANVMDPVEKGPLAAAAQLALQFELIQGTARTGRSARIGLRPVKPGRGGSWIRTGVSWATLGYYPRTGDRHATLLREIASGGVSGPASTG